MNQHLKELKISIHAPHARSDQTLLLGRAEVCISIHAPHARSDGAGALKSSM